MAQQSALPRGLRNNNPLNLRISNIKWRGKVPVQHNTDGAFEQFDTIVLGIRAAMCCLRTYINKYRLNTVQSIIFRWAPPTENNTSAYVRRVCELMSISPARIISVADRAVFCSLAWSMAVVECGRVVDRKFFYEAYALL